MTKALLAVGDATKRFINFTIMALGVAALYLLVVAVGIPSIATWGSRLQSAFFPPLQDVTADTLGADGLVQSVVYPAFRINSYKWDGDDLVMSGQLCKVQPYEFIGAWWAFGKLDGVWYEARLENGSAKEDGPRTRPTGCQFWTNWRLKNALNAPLKQFFGRLRYMPEHKNWMVYQTLGPFSIPPEVDTKAVNAPTLPPDATDPINEPMSDKLHLPQPRPLPQ